MSPEKSTKTCFVIAPIGDEAGDIRHRSDQILTHIIEPVVKECGYEEVIRADRISVPGMITTQIIEKIINCDLVIADLTGPNANVFYELAIRHVIKKPVVQIIQMGETIPFDVSPTRTIKFNHTDLDSVANCKSELKKQIQAAEKDPSQADNPISMTVALQSLKQTDRPLEKGIVEIITILQELMTMIRSLARSISYSDILPRPFDSLQSILGTEEVTTTSSRSGVISRLFEEALRK